MGITWLEQLSALLTVNEFTLKKSKITEDKIVTAKSGGVHKSYEYRSLLLLGPPSLQFHLRPPLGSPGSSLTVLSLPRTHQVFPPQGLCLCCSLLSVSWLQLQRPPLGQRPCSDRSPQSRDFLLTSLLICTTPYRLLLSGGAFYPFFLFCSVSLVP